MILRAENADCMDIMKEYPDKYFDLAVIDGNYGIGEDGKKNHSRSKLAKSKKYTCKNWDKESISIEIINEIIRVSKNQIFWGANHFISKLPYDSSCWIVWDKLNGPNDFADCELAWTSFNTSVRKFTYRWSGMFQGELVNGKDDHKKQIRIHPTEKPIQLYEWIYKNYAKPEFKVIDTHGGSFSNLIAADNFGLSEFVICEIDKEYFDAGMNRYNQFKRQLKLF